MSRGYDVWLLMSRTFRLVLALIGQRSLRVLSGVAACALGVALTCVPVALGELDAILPTSHGDVWFTEPTKGLIGEFRPDRSFRWFETSPGSEPGSLSSGPAGQIWFTERKTRKIGRISPNGSIREVSVPLPPKIGPPGQQGIDAPLSSHELPEPGVITAGPEGNMWFTDGGGSNGVSSVYGGQIDRITPTGTITEYEIPSPNSEPHRVVAGPDGDLWFTESTLNGGAIGRVAPGGAITIFALPEQHEPGGLVAGPDGALWFTDVVFGAQRIVGMIGRISTSGSIRYFPLPNTEAQPQNIALGTDGAMWFTAAAPHMAPNGSSDTRARPFFVGVLGRIAPSGHVQEFSVPHPPLEIASGRDHQMLFTQEASNSIGRITPSGKVSEISNPAKTR